MTKPSNIKKQADTSHRSELSGFIKIHMLGSVFRDSSPMPRSVNGNVKSTYRDLLAVIVISPTAASNS